MPQVEAWCRIADVLLHREALVSRLADGVVPRDFAGMYVDSAELDRVLSTLPGLDGPPPHRTEAVRAAVEGEVSSARAAFAHELTSGTSTFARLASSARLDSGAAEVLALVAAVELDPRRQRLVAYIQDSVQLSRLTLAMLTRIFQDEPKHPGALAVAPGARLRTAALLELDGTGPWAIQMVSIPARVAWALTGSDAAETGLPPGSARYRRGIGAPTADNRVFIISGADRATRLRAVRVAWVDRGLIVVKAPTSRAEWAALVREATIAGLVAVLEVDGALDAVAREEIDRASHLPWAVLSSAELPLETLPERSWSEIQLTSETADKEDWRSLFDAPPAAAYRLDREQLRLTAQHARGDVSGLAAAVRRLAGGHLSGVARRVRPSRTWTDLVLPPDQMSQLHELTARHRLRSTVYGTWGYDTHLSTGVVALFSGQSGTGKTLAAEIVAGSLGLDLYKVDLSAVVSKYIGETEKNLERIFSAAAAGDLVLFFDEADALFGKRSEISDAHDRYANIEVAYLLQRLEAYDGLVVLATNLQRNIDPAFLRRIAVAVDFAVPDERERHAIWRLAIPPAAPVGELDRSFVARQFKVTGGVIRNAALGAAFLAADAGSSISTELVVVAMKREFQKLGRLVTEKEFGRYFELVTREQPGSLANGSAANGDTPAKQSMAGQPARPPRSTGRPHRLGSARLPAAGPDQQP